jgi:hypothetical protein
MTNHIKYIGTSNTRTLRAEDLSKLDKTLVFKKGEPLEIPVAVWDEIKDHPGLKNEFKEATKTDMKNLEKAQEAQTDDEVDLDTDPFEVIPVDQPDESNSDS